MRAAEVLGMSYGKGEKFDGATFYSSSDMPDGLEHRDVEAVLAPLVDEIVYDGREANLDAPRVGHPSARELVFEHGPITIWAWQHVPGPRPGSFGDPTDIVERLEDEWHEGYGDPEGDVPPWSNEQRRELLGELQDLIDKYIAYAKVWQCNITTSASFSPGEICELLKVTE